MTCDIHTWRPLPLRRGAYICECGAIGVKRARRIRAAPRVKAPTSLTVRMTYTSDGRIMPKPGAP